MSPTSYKALVVTAPLGEYVVKSVPLPTPGSGQLLVKVAGAALNYIDYKLQAWGWYKDSYPITVGFDGSGSVEAIGDGVTDFVKGDHV